MEAALAAYVAAVEAGAPDAVLERLAAAVAHPLPTLAAAAAVGVASGARRVISAAAVAAINRNHLAVLRTLICYICGRPVRPLAHRDRAPRPRRAPSPPPPPPSPPLPPPAPNRATSATAARRSAAFAPAASTARTRARARSCST